MRVITTTVYTFDELSTDAQRAAVDEVRDHLAGPWWDDSDTAEVSETIVYALAQKLGTPGHDTYGVGDFPGIPGLELRGWDLDRGNHLLFDGRLTRQNAPALPWHPGYHSVHLRGRTIEPALAEDDCACDTEAADAHDPDCLIGAAAAGAYAALRRAVEHARDEALKAGHEELEYKSSEEYARVWIESNTPEFHTDGRLA